MIFDIKKEAIELSQALIRRESISPNDGGCLDFIANYFRNLNLEVEFIDFGDVKNLYVKNGSEESLCFAGHVDVVPPGYTWTHDPFEAKIIDDVLYGRGAVDMKIGIACAMAVFKSILMKNPKAPLSMLLTSDEEALAENGLKKVVPRLKEKGEKFKFFLLGEPTCKSEPGDQIKIGRRGSVTAKIEFLGLQGHIAYPELADNPIPRIVKACSELMDLDFEDEDSVFGKSKIQLTSIDNNNDVENLIPGTGSVMFGIRFNPKQSFESIKSKVLEVLEKTAKPYLINWRFHGLPFVVDDSKLIGKLVNSIKSVTQKDVVFDAKGATSDGRFLTKLAPVFEIGLQEDLAHKIDERASLKDIKILCDIYGKIFNDFLV